MKWRYRFLIVLTLLPAQTLFLEYFRIKGVKPDLALVLVYLFGLVHGRGAGLLWGLAMGTILDLFSVGVLGLNLGFKTSVGYLAGTLGRSLAHLTFLANAAILFGISLLQDIVGTILLHGMGPDRMNDLFLLTRSVFIPRAFYNSLLAAGLFLIFVEKINIKGSLEHAGVLFPTRGNSRFTE